METAGMNLARLVSCRIHYKAVSCESLIQHVLAGAARVYQADSKSSTICPGSGTGRGAKM
jgi:hypothetical protein